MSERFDPQPVLDGLKDFQRATVEHVFDRLYGADGTKRFLVADEVGLGKTLVARGVIARSIERLQHEGVDRIDIVYVCSNADIARQNINRLNVTNKQEFNLPTRLTLLPLHLRQLKQHGLNFVSFTPGTTFDLKSRSGLAEERALIYRLLQHAWGRRGLGHVGVMQVLRASSGLESFKNRVANTPDRVGTTEFTIDRDLADAFAHELQEEERRASATGVQGIRERFMELADRNRKPRNSDWNARQAVVGELRTILARSCVRALEPDLIILDEFQRFRDLLDGESDAAELARHLFDQDTARVLLLSATPYRMYTLADEHDDNHLADFMRTMRFLMGRGEAVAFGEELRAYRRAVMDIEDGDLVRIGRRKKAVEGRLRRFMVRTERLGMTEDRNGMLEEAPSPALRLEPADLRAYLAAERVSQYLGAGDMVEYWKSGSYLLNFMESYKLKRLLRAAKDDATKRHELAELIRDADGLLPAKAIRRYARIDPGNARLRALMQDVVENDAWRLLWLPPALPDYRLEGAYGNPALSTFTKRLVFSAWTMVPQVLATLISYEVERRMFRLRGPGYVNTPEARRQIRPLLRFGRSDGRLTGMSLLSLLYPSPALARLGDPHELGARAGRRGEVADLASVLRGAEHAIGRALRPLLAGRPHRGPVDDRWYWAAPLLLDASTDQGATAAWLCRPAVADRWTGAVATDGDDSLWSEHVDEARRISSAPGELGRVPPDLAAVLARVAVGSPAICALRAFARVSGGIEGVAHTAVRDGAARIAWGFRSLFNVPEVMAMVRGQGGDDGAYWSLVLDHCAAGGLQAVLSEYVHVLRESLGHLGHQPEVIVPEMAATTYDALSIRAANYSADDLRVENGDLTLDSWKLRARYALRFGTQSLEDSAELQRAGAVRTAFNSPFWPFVLATTSVGQEGLDFHQYCHAVVHWNLPANPVDLEQREGRVHRYKGHAIRKNIAARHRKAAFVGGDDPWEAMFQAALKARSRRETDLIPYWIYPGQASIERHVPSFPLSREIERMHQLKKSLALYRMAIGWPRQQDQTEFLARHWPNLTSEEVRKVLLLDLSPQRRR